MTPASSPGGSGVPPVLRPSVFITGGAKRVGRAIALAFARAGCDVDFSYLTSEAEAKATQRDIQALAAACNIWKLDLSTAKQAWADAEQIASSRGVWDAVVISASSYHSKPFEKLTPEDLLRDFHTNAASAAMVIQKFVPGLRNSTRRGGGAIVTMCDIHAMGELGQPRKEHVSYGMSKAALLEMTLVLARELAPQIRVNAVAPGVAKFPDSGPESDPAQQAKYLSRVPLGRAGTPEEAAEAVRWLAMDATYCIGQVIRVDGGRAIT